MSTLPVIEVFGPTLQGEGLLIGLRTLFIRLAGCDWSCSWCDTPYSWRPGSLAAVQRLDPPAILLRLRSLDPATHQVTLSGGNPALHDCTELLHALHAEGYRVHVETQGSLAPTWLGLADSVTVSPKGPSSGMPPAWNELAGALARSRAADLKIVVFDEADLAFASEAHRRHPERPLCLQVGNRVGVDSAEALLQRARWLAARVLEQADFAAVRVLPQWHVLLWGNARGV